MNLLATPKWSLWHGNVHKSLERLDTLIELIEHDPRVQDGPERNKLSRALNELTNYLESNRDLIPTYGDRRRHGEAISSSIAESTRNQVISRRFVKKQQMRWQPPTAHLLLQIRTRTLNGTLRETFQRWWPAMVSKASAPGMSQSLLSVPFLRRHRITRTTYDFVSRLSSVNGRGVPKQTSLFSVRLVHLDNISSAAAMDLAEAYMATVGESVRKSIDDWTLDQHEFAMLHACNAVDGTAGKLHPELGNKARFTRVVRDNYLILGPMGIPGINLVETRWPVKVKSPTAAGGLPDIADVIYTIHRCTHGHGDELPDGFALIPNAAGPHGFTQMTAAKGKVQLSDRVIFGLLAVAVFSPVNTDQRVPDGYHFTFAGTVLPINEWWGRAAEFLAIAAQHPLPNIKMDFADWMDVAQPHKKYSSNI